MGVLAGHCLERASRSLPALQNDQDEHPPTHLVEVEDEVELADVVEEGVWGKSCQSRHRERGKVGSWIDDEVHGRGMGMQQRKKDIVSEKGVSELFQQAVVE